MVAMFYNLKHILVIVFSQEQTRLIHNRKGGTFSFIGDSYLFVFVPCFMVSCAYIFF